jgi:hypothetical protein
MLKNNSYPYDVGDAPVSVASSLNEPAKGHDNDERMRVAPECTELGSNPKDPRAEASFGQDLEVADFTVGPRNTEGVAHGAICGMLIEGLEDVSFHFLCVLV